MRSIYISVFLAALLSACYATSTPQGMKRFVDIKEWVVKSKQRVDGYLEKTTGVDLLGIQEIRPGVLEYSFIDKKKYRPFEDPSKNSCKFIFVVDKNTGVIIGWRYNDKSEYCYSGNT
jgi:hypothetical protein